jgi:hypothetical protein
LFILFVCLWSYAALCSVAPQAAFTRKKKEEGDGSIVAVATLALARDQDKGVASVRAYK